MAVADAVAERAVVEVRDVDLTDGKGGSVYVVQRLEPSSPLPLDEAGAGRCWTDVARVTAPVRAKRATILRAAVKGAGLSLPKSGVSLRVLDAAAAHEHKVGLKPRDPELVIG